jgi:hypothetical protein
MALQGIQAAELSKNQHSRDFWRRSIFDFFNSNGPFQPRLSRIIASVFGSLSAAPIHRRRGSL